MSDENKGRNEHSHYPGTCSNWNLMNQNGTNTSERGLVERALRLIIPPQALLVVARHLESISDPRCVLFADFRTNHKQNQYKCRVIVLVMMVRVVFSKVKTIHPSINHCTINISW